MKLPDGYRIPPHTHPKPERITVISGTFNIGMGEKFDDTKGMALPAGARASTRRVLQPPLLLELQRRQTATRHGARAPGYGPQ